MTHEQVRLEPLIDGPGRYPTRGGHVAVVERRRPHSLWPWVGRVEFGDGVTTLDSWSDGGMSGALEQSPYDIVGPRIVHPQPDAEPLTEGELQAWSELAAKATAGDLRRDRIQPADCYRYGILCPAGIYEYRFPAEDDAELFNQARNALPRLVAEIRRLREGAPRE